MQGRVRGHRSRGEGFDAGCWLSALSIFRLAGKGTATDKILLKAVSNADEPKRVYVFCPRNFVYMERLLSILFSVVLLIATAPPKTGSGCNVAVGFCVLVENCAAPSSESSCSLDHKGDCSEKSACPIPICCVCGPCCCLCIVPERPVLPTTILLDEQSVKIFTHPVFLPQQVWLSVWKPPAFQFEFS